MDSVTKWVVGVIAAIFGGAIIMAFLEFGARPMTFDSCTNLLNNQGYYVVAAGQCAATDIIPCSDNTYDIGELDREWAEIWGETIYARENIFVGTGTPGIPIVDGDLFVTNNIRCQGAITGIAKDWGPAVFISDTGEGTIEHTGTGSFDLTGGTFDNLFTATVPVFEATDASAHNYMGVISGAHYGAIAEIEHFIDASNVVLNTLGWDEDLTDVTFAIVQHPIFLAGSGGRIGFDLSGEGLIHLFAPAHTGMMGMYVEATAAVDDLRTICLDIDADGYEGVRALCIEYEAGDLQPSDQSAVIKVDFDDTGATSSDATTEVNLIYLSTTDTQALIKHAIHVAQGFDSALTVAGSSSADPAQGYEVTAADVPTDRVNGVAPDGTAFLQASASDLNIFDVDNNYILIGSAATFEAVEIVLSVNSSVSILPTFYYSTGAGTWAALTVTDTTNGFASSGTIAFTSPGAWAATNAVVPAGAAIGNGFYIKIVRTRNNLVTLPQEDYFKTYATSSTTDFEIRGDGTIRPVEMADASAPNNSLYFSTTQNKLVYKDNGGVIHDLW